MNENYHRVNYEHAKNEANKIDEIIIETLQSGCSFRVEAGAGSGKTYSLNRVIDWVQENKFVEYSQKKQNAVCITYTNAAVGVISERLSINSFILPSTIHSFAWNAIKQFQNFLINFVTNDPDFTENESESLNIKEVAYTLGHRFKENGIQYLYHDDVLNLFCKLLDNVKFRSIFANKYPLILIDEYQDSYEPIMKCFVKYFISEKKSPQFALFGDSWQTIYKSNNACGIVEHENLKVIKKGSNFRSAPKIVSFLNRIRPNLPQISAIDNFEGEVVVVTCNDYNGLRRNEKNYSGDLPLEELKNRLNNVIDEIKKNTPKEETLKVLMITHKVLASQQGYEQLFKVLDVKFREKEDPFLLFFMYTIEPIYQALITSNMQLLFDTLGIKRYPITKKSEKIKWKNLQKQLCEARKKKAIDVLEIVNQSKLIPVSPKIEELYRQYQKKPETLYTQTATIQDFLNIDYSQFIAAKEFLCPESLFSTEHGVKGEEYDNVVFVISKGWNQYQFEIYTPMINGIIPIPSGKENSFERNRNLFYVCCSRAKKRLILFITIPFESYFKEFLTKLVGVENIYTYQKFLELNRYN